MFDSPKKKMKEGAVLEGIWETVFNVSVTNACQVELDCLEANLVSKVGGKEAKCGFSVREAWPPLGAAEGGVTTNASLAGTTDGVGNCLGLKEG